MSSLKAHCFQFAWTKPENWNSFEWVKDLYIALEYSHIQQERTHSCCEMTCSIIIIKGYKLFGIVMQTFKSSIQTHSHTN